MKTFPLIILLLALASAALLGGLYWRTDAAKSQLEHALSVSQSDNLHLGTTLSEAEQLSEQQQAQLNSLDADLGATKTALTTARSQNITLQREIARLEQDAETLQRTRRQLRSEVNTLNQALAEARSAEVSADSVASYRQTIRDLEQQLATARSRAQPSSIPVLVTHRSRSTSVVSVGPSNAFVVLNYGASHGALPAQTMSIHRGTNLLATVQISDVRENYSIAQVRPDSLRDSLQKGDVATLTP